MRRGLIATVVAVVLFAIGAFAASFVLNAEDVASGRDAVTACAAEVDVDFTTEYDDATHDEGGVPQGDWNVTQAVLTFYDDQGGQTTGCAGFGANVAVLTGDGGTPAATGTATVQANASTVTVELDPGTVKVAEVTGAAVLVDGENLRVGTPEQGL
jgi:hypothetical protein